MSTLQFRRAICKTPPLSMASGITSQTEIVDVKIARQQHEKYVSNLEQLGVDVTVLGPDEAMPDSHFVEDAAIIHADVAILTRPGATTRRMEAMALRPALMSAGLQIVALGGGDEALVDGGDVLFAGNHVLIGLSHRTTQEGAQRLKNILLEINPSLNVCLINFDGVLHLKSGVTYIGNDTLLGNPAMSLTSQLPLDIIWLPSQDGYAANTLTLNGSVFYFEECPSVEKAIMSVGLKPLPMNMSEFRKMDGSFTCLSLLW